MGKTNKNPGDRDDWEPRSMKEQLGALGGLSGVQAAKERRRQEVREQAHLENQDGSGPSFLSEIAKSANLSDELVEELRHPKPIPIPEVHMTPTQTTTSTSAEKDPLHAALRQPPTPRVEVPDPVSKPFQKLPVDRRMTPPQMQQQMPIPPVPLTPEQEELYAWMFLEAAVEAHKEAKRLSRLSYLNQLATLVLSILGIAAGGLAIRTGLRASSNRDGRD